MCIHIQIGMIIKRISPLRVKTVWGGLLRGSESSLEIRFDLWRTTALCLLEVLLEDIA